MNHKLELGCFMPNTGFQARSHIEHTTTWEWEYNKKVATIAEGLGFEHLISINNMPIAAEKPEFQGFVLDPIPYTAGLLAVTSKINVITTVYSVGINPYLLAKIAITLDQMGNGRCGINIVSGGNESQYRMAGLPWLEHDERYRMSTELIQILRGLWTEEQFTFKGKYYSVENARALPKPISQPHPKIVQAGHSPAALEFTAKYADYLFLNGGSNRLESTISEARQKARDQGRDIKIIISTWLTWDKDRAKAQEEYEEIVEKRDRETVENTRKARMAGNYDRSDLVGEDTWVFGGVDRIVGTPGDIIDRFKDYKKMGVDVVAFQFKNFAEDLERFGADVLPLMQEEGLR